jgi:hypothetical protein
MAVFTISADTVHHVGDHSCPTCFEDYPEPCRCGGLMHAECGVNPDDDGSYAIVTRCDYCGRTDDEPDLP